MCSTRVTCEVCFRVLRDPMVWLRDLRSARMNLEKVRRICLAFPGATEQVQWGADLVFKVGGKMFAVAATEPSGQPIPDRSQT